MLERYFHDPQCSSFRKMLLLLFWGASLMIAGVVSGLGVRSAGAQQPDLPTNLQDGVTLDTTSQRIVRPSRGSRAQLAPKAALSDLESFSPVQQVDAEEWPREDINFPPVGFARPAGDVNGDGVQDVIYRYAGVPDDRTSDPVRTPKTFLRFGGESFSSEYYDQLVYRSLIPAGDLLGSGNADAIVRDSASITVFEGGSGGYSETGTRSFSINGSAAGTADLDGDGFDDLVFTGDFSDPSITVLYGGQTLSDLSVQSYEPAFEKTARFSYAVGDADEDGTGNLLRVHGATPNDDSLAFDLYEVTSGRDLSLQQGFATDLPGFAAALNPQLANIDGTSLQEIYVQGADSASGTFVFGVGSNDTYDNTPIEYPNADELVGDLNEDGRADFYLDTDNGPFIGFGPTTVEDGVSPDVSIPSGERLGFRTSAPLGDLTGDGEGNVILGVQLQSQFGNRRVGVSGGTAQTADVLFDNADYLESFVVSGTNVGDWDGDNTDDAALVTETFDAIENRTEGAVDIYFGDPRQSVTPDLTLANPNDARVRTVASGDFTGNGQQNLVVVWADSMPNVSVYEAGNGSSPIRTYDTEDIGPIGEGEFLRTASTSGNVGDVNGDGTEDFLIGAPSTSVGGTSVQEAFLFLGGDPLPSGPSVTIDYSGQDADPGSLASGIEGLGDINQDGIEDFAVANPFGNFDFSNGFRIGQVFVHYGQEGGAGDLDFDQPDEVITPNPGSGEELIYFGFGLASGDFNGDGIPDLATKPFIFRNQEGDGLEAVHVYFGPDFDDPVSADARVPIPGDPVDPDGNETGPNGNLTENLGELATVPLFDDSPRDGLLLGTGFGTTNALVFETTGGEAETFEATTVLQAYDSGTGLGANNNFISNNNRTSAIGIFAAESRLTPVFGQPNTPFFRGRPGFTYDLPTLQQDQRFGTEQEIATASVGEELYVRDIADLDGDGDRDLLGVSAIDDTLQFRWYANDGSGTFSEQPPIQTIVETPDLSLASIEAADLDQDGDQDLLWTTSRKDKIVWQENQGGATFGPPQTISQTAVDPEFFTVGDIDGDNDLDVVTPQDLTVSGGYKGLVWYPNQIGESGADEDGFGQRQIITSDFLVTRPRLADFDRDGTLDVLLDSGFDFEEDDNNRIRLYKNLGGGTFADLQAIAVGNGDTETVRPADLNEDGRYDILGSEEVIGWYSNEGDAEFSSQTVIGSSSFSLPDADLTSTAADLDGDGTPDLAVASPTGGALTWRPGTGNGQFGDPLLISVETREAARPAAADLDGDGDSDLLVQSRSIEGGELAWYQNEGTSAPAVPTGLTASQTDQGVELSWSSVPEASGYNVYRALRPFRNPTAAVKINDDPVGTTSLTDSTGAGGQRFYYRVTTLASGTESTPSDPANAILTNVTASQVATVEGDGTVDFGETGVNVNFSEIQGSGDVEVTKFDNPPAGTSSIDGENASTFRFEASVEGDLEFGSSTEFRLDVSSLSGVTDPEDVSIYKRSDPGQGTFTEIPTTYDEGSDELVATVSSFSEFALGSNANPLPVELSGFDATTSGETVRLTWQTASETGNARFEVQRKSGPRSKWKTVGSVEGAGTTTEAQSYRFTDEDLPYEASRLTYRLRQVDLDGTASLSRTVTVERGAEELELLETYPNPASRQATVRYAVPESQKITLRLYDMLGRRVRTLARGTREGRNKASVDVSGLPSGIYFLRLRAEDQTRTRKLTIVR